MSAEIISIDIVLCLIVVGLFRHHKAIEILKYNISDLEYGRRSDLQLTDHWCSTVRTIERKLDQVMIKEEFKEKTEK